MLDHVHRITKLLNRDRRYPIHAYVFVFEALKYAQKVLEMGVESPSERVGGRREEKETPEHHVTGQQLCEAIRRYALQQYGYMAKTVLNSWGIYSTGDFGEIVFNLIRIGEMRKTPGDRREDFDGLYDFDTAFKRQFKFQPT